MAIRTQINRIKAAKAAIIEEIKSKGVTVDDNSKIEDIPNYIKSIETSVNLPEWKGGSY